MAVKRTQNIPVNNNILDVITPSGIEFNKADFQFGDLVARVITISNYPSQVAIAWLSRIANMEGVTCSIHLTPTDPSKLIENISKSMGELAGRIATGGNHLMMQRTEQQYRDAETLMKLIDQEQEQVYFVTIALMITAIDREELNKKAKRVESVIAGSRMRSRTAMFRQEDALHAVSPYGECPEVVKEISSRNMPVSTVAASFPFNTSGLNDGQGYLLGRDVNGGIILLDSWKRGGDRTNSNYTILGASGTGKSASIKHIFTNEYAQGTKIIIIDPEREYKDLCENLGGQWISCGGGSGGRINPLQVKTPPIEDGEDLYKDEGKGMGALALHFQTLRTFFKLYIKNLDDIDQAILEETLEELYASRGITWETDVTRIPNTQYPIMGDLHSLLIEKSKDPELTNKRREKYEKLIALVRKASVGADAPLWNGHTTLEADADFIVLDTHDLQEADDTIKRTQYFNILTWCWQEMSKDRTERVMLGCDEAHLLIGGEETLEAMLFLRSVSKRIRKYNGGLVVISQSVGDFLDPAVKRYGQSLLDNAAFKLLLGTDGKNLQETAELFDLTEAEVEMLSKKKRGEGLLIAGSRRLHAKIEISDFELELFGAGGGN